MLGAIVNAVAIIVGALLGLALKNLISQRISDNLVLSLSLCVFVIGVKMALEFENILVMIFCVALGGILGTLLKVEERTEAFARRAQNRFGNSKDDRFAKGFTFTSILFCTGSMAIIGSINSGAAGDHDILFAKALMDGAISISLASVYGVGVAFSALPVLLYEGALTMGASSIGALSKAHVLADISGVGGVLLTMIGLKMAKVRDIAVGDFLPAMLLVLIVATAMDLLT